MASNRENYKILELIGEGVTSKVYKCIYNGRIVALKSVRKVKLSGVEKLMSNELKVQRALKTLPYICHLIHHFQDSRHIYFVYEYVRGITLNELVKALASGDNTTNVIPTALVKLWSCQLIAVLRGLIDKRCIHRDLKSENIMLRLGDVCVIDFNSAHQYGEGDDGGGTLDADEPTGTISYWPPEIINFRLNAVELPPDYSYHAQDVWAVGCIIYEMLMGHTPFHVTDTSGILYAEDTEYILNQIRTYCKNGHLLFPLDDDVGLLRDLCLKLLNPDPAARLAFIKGNPLSHPIFETMPAFLPPQLDPFSLTRAIYAHKQDCDISSMELTPNAGEAFAGRLLSDFPEQEQLRGSADALRYTNQAHYVSLNPARYGQRIGTEPRYYVEWQVMENEMDAQDIKQAVNEKFSADTCVSPPAASSTSPGSPDSPLTTLSAEHIVTRVINKIQGLLRCLKSDETTIKIWGAAHIQVSPVKRRSSVLDDSYGWCCNRIIPANLPVNPNTANQTPPTWTFAGYAIIYEEKVLLITEQDEQLQCLNYDGTNRLFYLKAEIRSYSAESGTTELMLYAWSWTIKLDVGSKENQNLWRQCLLKQFDRHT